MWASSLGIPNSLVAFGVIEKNSCQSTNKSDYVVFPNGLVELKASIQASSISNSVIKTAEEQRKSH